MEFHGIRHLMMKRIMKLKCILLLFLCNTIVQAKETELKTTIKEVTVFQNGAQVRREGNTNLLPGTYDIAIRDFTPSINKESIQLSAEGTFTILSVNHQVRKEEQSVSKERINELSREQIKLEKENEELELALRILRAEEKIISNLESINTAQAGVSVDQIVRAQEVMHTKMSSIKTEQLRIQRIVRDKTEAEKDVKRELMALRSIKQEVINEIIIHVKVQEETKAKFILSYIVPNARWYATYDLRVKTINDPLQIDYKAQITQQTGEEWKNVKLKLSTGDPSENQARPKIEPWILQLNQPYKNPYSKKNYYRYTDFNLSKAAGTITDRETGEPLPFCNVMVKGQSIGATTDLNGKFHFVIPPDARELSIFYVGYESISVPITGDHLYISLQRAANQLNEVTIAGCSAPLIDSKYSETTVTRSDIVKQHGKANYQSAEYKTTEIIENIIVTEFEIEDQATIASDPKETTVMIKTIQSPVHYQYFCAPRLDKDVFLTAQITNWESYNLLQGNASIFFEGSYIGKTLLDTRFLTDTLDISMGRDKSILIERNKEKEYNKKQILGNDQVTMRDWNIVARNGKQQKISVIIEDQYPVSADNRIEIRKEDHSGGKLDESTGIITWSLEIAPGEVRNLKLKYSVKYPKGNWVGLD